MKNIVNIAAFLMLCLYSSFAQTVTVQDSGVVNFDGFIQSTFANVNTATATTGKLIHRAPNFINVEDYDGSTVADSLSMTMDKFSAIYAMLYAANFSPATQLPDPLIAYNNNTTEGGGGVNRLFILAQTYNYFNPDAIVQGRIYAANNVFNTVGTSNLYAQDTVFAVGSEQLISFGTSVSFKLAADKIFNNWGVTISNLTIDWGDGLGNRSYAVGSTLTVNYPTI